MAPPPPTKAIGENIRQVMKTKNATQTMLADHLKIPQVTVSRRLRGITPIDVNELFQIAECLGVTVISLLPKSARKEPPQE